MAPDHTSLPVADASPAAGPSDISLDGGGADVRIGTSCGIIWRYSSLDLVTCCPTSMPVQDAMGKDVDGIAEGTRTNAAPLCVVVDQVFLPALLSVKRPQRE